METLVVADPKMVEYHGKNGVETYVLAVMNVVSISLLCSLFLLGGWSFQNGAIEYVVECESPNVESWCDCVAWRVLIG